MATTSNAPALAALRAAGVRLLRQYDNGRRVVLVVEHPPAFVTGSMCRRQPAGGGGHEYIMAAPYHGAQLEWRTRVAPPAEVGHG